MGLGQDGAEQPSALVSTVSSLLSPFTGVLAEGVQKISDPLIEKMQPMIREELTRQVPTFAIYAGITMGALVLLGIYTGILTTRRRAGAR